MPIPSSFTDSLRRFFNAARPRVKVQDRWIGDETPVFIIAEIGNNHNGDFELAKNTILAAKEAGADAVKFQKRNVDELLSKEMKEMPYDNPRSFGKTYREHRVNQELSIEQYRELKDFTENLGLVFFATPFDKTSADELESIGVHAYKIASFDVTNHPLLEYVAKKGKPMLLSTGGSTLEEIDRAIETILAHNTLLVVNHCTSLYPTPDHAIDLNMVRVLKQRYAPVPVGYSGHEPDILPTIVSIALGARTVERHFTLDKEMKGSDHHMSINPVEFKEMSGAIRRIEVVLGSSKKRLHEGETAILQKLGKSIVATRDIKKGERIKTEDLITKSPGTGINPRRLSQVVGTIAAIDIEADTILPVEALTWSR